MGRTIKLLLYFFAYQLAFMGVAICGYMLYQGSYEVPQTPDSLYTNLIMLAQILSTAAVGIHLLVGKYVGLDQKTWGYHHSPKLLATSVVFILAMGLWTNYFNELADLPNNMQEAFEMINDQRMVRRGYHGSHCRGTAVPWSHSGTFTSQMETSGRSHRTFVIDFRSSAW